MNKNIAIVAVVALLVVGGGIAALQMNQDSDTVEKSSTMKKSESDAVVNKNTTDNQQMDTAATAPNASAPGRYVNLADFDANREQYSNARTVYFFHASWCPNCQAIDKTLAQDDSNIPAGVTIIKTDFDKETDLRQKYGVTLQYTFVEVDKDGNELKQWSAPTINDVFEEL